MNAASLQRRKRARSDLPWRPPLRRSGAFELLEGREKGGVMREHAAIGRRIYAFLPSASLGSATLARAALLARYGGAKAAGAPAAQLDQLAAAATAIGDKPAALERLLLAAQFGDLVRGLGARDTLTVALLGGRTAEAAAAELLAHTALADSAAIPGLLAGDLAASSDPALAFDRRVAHVLAPLAERARALAARAQNLGAKLARARFDVYGKAVPPDATFTLRLADGTVKGYPYNGTQAPPFTTFYGMYDRYASAGGKAPWSLPPRWRQPPPGLDLSTPLDLVSTNDITGGNSGSPLLTKNLELVGLIFDGNIESLPGNFIYTDERARAVSVHARAILAALRTAYGASRIVTELEER